jgi:hypothetical protein
MSRKSNYQKIFRPTVENYDTKEYKFYGMSGNELASLSKADRIKAYKRLTEDVINDKKDTFSKYVKGKTEEDQKKYFDITNSCLYRSVTPGGRIFFVNSGDTARTNKNDICYIDTSSVKPLRGTQPSVIENFYQPFTKDELDLVNMTGAQIKSLPSDTARDDKYTKMAKLLSSVKADMGENAAMDKEIYNSCIKYVDGATGLINYSDILQKKDEKCYIDSKFLASVTKAPLNPSRPVAPPVKPVAPPVKPVAPPVKPVAPPVKPVAPPVKPVAPPVKPVAPPVKPVAPPVKPVAPPVKPVAPPVKPVVTQKPVVKPPVKPVVTQKPVVKPPVKPVVVKPVVTQKPIVVPTENPFVIETEPPMVEWCPPGTYSTNGQMPCLKCPQGTFSKGAATKCDPVKPVVTQKPIVVPTENPFVIETEPPMVEWCQPGTYSTNGQMPCLKCPEGTFSKGAATKCDPINPPPVTQAPIATDCINFYIILSIDKSFLALLNRSLNELITIYNKNELSPLIKQAKDYTDKIFDVYAATLSLKKFFENELKEAFKNTEKYIIQQNNFSFLPNTITNIAQAQEYINKMSLTNKDYINHKIIFQNIINNALQDTNKFIAIYASVNATKNANFCSGIAGYLLDNIKTIDQARNAITWMIGDSEKMYNMFSNSCLVRLFNDDGSIILNRLPNDSNDKCYADPVNVTKYNAAQNFIIDPDSQPVIPDDIGINSIPTSAPVSIPGVTYDCIDFFTPMFFENSNAKFLKNSYSVNSQLRGKIENMITQMKPTYDSKLEIKNLYTKITDDALKNPQKFIVQENIRDIMTAFLDKPIFFPLDFLDLSTIKQIEDYLNKKSLTDKNYEEVNLYFNAAKPSIINEINSPNKTIANRGLEIAFKESNVCEYPPIVETVEEGQKYVDDLFSKYQTYMDRQSNNCLIQVFNPDGKIAVGKLPKDNKAICYIDPNTAVKYNTSGPIKPVAPLPPRPVVKP